MAGLRRLLEDFAEAFPCPLQDVTRARMETWLEAVPRGPGRWNHILGTVCALARFARKEGAIGSELVPVEQMEKRRQTHTVQIYTVDELKAILAGAEREWLPVFVLGAFSGLRPEEIAPEAQHKPGLCWEHLLWDKDKVDVPAEVSKVKRRRFAHLPENAKAWLEPWRKASGLIGPKQRFCHSPRNFAVTWKPDGLRHSYASYRLALTKDVPALALEMGNSPSIIFRHYLEMVHEPEARAWFAVMP